MGKLFGFSPAEPLIDSRGRTVEIVAAASLGLCRGRVPIPFIEILCRVRCHPKIKHVVPGEKRDFRIGSGCESGCWLT